MTTELDALGILTTIPLLGAIRIRLLIQYFGSAQQALKADAVDIAQLPDFGEKISEGWKCRHQTATWESNLELVERHGVAVIPFTSPQYPKRLLELNDHPVILYMKGKYLPVDQQSIAVVGTRQATRYGLEMAERISGDLASSGFTVVSGLARGIDTAAHVGALAKGRTIAVIGSGLADIYPRENIVLADRIAENGVLMSEFPMATPPDRQNFPQRNRIVSGLTLGTFLVEAPLKSGAMLTMERALAQKKRLFALPGRVDYETFTGNHALVKSGKALLVESASDIADNFEDLFGHCVKLPSISKGQCIILSKEETDFLLRLPREERTIDEIAQITKLPVMRVNVLLMSLVLKKAIREFPGRIYKKV